MNGNAVTAEALLCGVSLGITLVAALVWFRCFNAVMTSDKLLFLFCKAFAENFDFAFVNAAVCSAF